MLRSNILVGSKVSKIRFDGGSTSNDYQEACAGTQTNSGHSYINRIPEAMGIEPGRTRIDHNTTVVKKKSDCSLQKKTFEFKRRRHHLHSSSLSHNSRKEQQEAKHMKSNVGLTQDRSSTLASTSKATREVFDFSCVSDETFKMYESTVSEFTLRPTCPDIVYHGNIFYNIIVFDTETNRLGREAELCQLSAIDKSGRCSFSEYILPNNSIDISASEVNKLFVRTVNGQRTLFKEAQPLETVTSSEALSRFISFLESSVDRCKTDKDVCTLLIGHNAKKFDVPVILRNSTSSFQEKMQSLGVFFGDSLSIFKQLIREKHRALQQSNGESCRANQLALYKCLFQKTYEAHDGLEDATALRKMLFYSKLSLSKKFIVNQSKPISFDYALENLQYLDRQHEIFESNKLYDPTGGGVITEGMAKKIARSGLTYEDLLKLFKEFGKPGLISILSKPPTKGEPGNGKRPRVTKNARILTAILRHFEENQHESSNMSIEQRMNYDY